MDIPILFEDENYIIINKPAGLVVHPDGKTDEPSLTDWLIKNYPKMKGVGEPLKLSGGETIDRPGIVHRLDRDTSGALVIAKTQKAFEDLKEKFQNREVSKKYHAFVYGEVKESEGVIDRPIGRSNKDFRMWSAQRGARGELREALTHYRVLARGVTGQVGEEGSAPEKFTFVEIEPKTGRTHQIRVHFKAINHPVICDPLYAPKRESALGFKRLALHSRSIGFVGISGNAIEATAPYPKDFQDSIEAAEEAADLERIAKE